MNAWDKSKKGRAWYKKYKAKWQRENKDKVKKYHRNYRNKLGEEKINFMNKESRQRQRRKIIKHYGNKCACCGEKEIKFLAVDHKNGGGNRHRAEVLGVKEGKGGNIYPWIIRNNFPDLFQILCHNCNLAKSFYKLCPHQNNNKS